jgi:RNA polymerase sigma-70 factor (TIGR02960 family)
MTVEVLIRAQAGDSDAFRELTEPFRRELHVHCYRMLGAFQDAEDVVQETLVSAWQGLPAFERRASIRTWLYRIATNRCLNALRSARRRPAKEWDAIDIEPPEPTGYGEVLWLEPYPDTLSDGAAGIPGPEARYEQNEAISLAFVTALQLLPPRQRAVLILREVLGYHALEVAEMLDSSVDSVTSALKRARAGLERHRQLGGLEPPLPDSPAEQELVARFVKTFEAGDVDGLVELLTADVNLSMPPIPLEYRGRDVVARFYSAMFASGRLYRLVPTRANGQPAFAAYLPAPTGGLWHGAGLFVLTLAGNRVSAMTRFESSALSWFGLPRSMYAFG